MLKNPGCGITGRRNKDSKREKHSSDSLGEKEIELDDVLWSNVRTNLEQYTKQVETIIQCSTTEKEGEDKEL